MNSYVSTMGDDAYAWLCLISLQAWQAAMATAWETLHTQLAHATMAKAVAVGCMAHCNAG
jgi:hypothetical protein